MSVTTIAVPRPRSLMRIVADCLFHAAYEELFSWPSRLVQTLKAHPQMRVHIADSDAEIDERRVVRWHEWGDSAVFASPHGGRGSVTGWKAVDGAYVTAKTTIPALMAFAKCHSTIEWSCEIQALCGLSSSKSDLSQFSTLDLLVQRNARPLIADISRQGLARNLAHPGIGILHRPNTTDHFVRFAWDRRIFLDNTDGSHHLAAARFIAHQIGEPVTLSGLLRTYAVSEEAVSLINADYHMFAVSDDSTVKQAFHEAMRSFKATYFLHRLPAPIDNAVAVLLPRNDRRSVAVASVMREARFFDIGAHLASVCARQRPMI